MTSQEAEIVNLPGVERKRAVAIVDRTAWGKVLAEYTFTSDDGSLHNAPGSARSIALDFIDRCNSHSKRLNPSLDESCTSLIRSPEANSPSKIMSRSVFASSSLIFDRASGAEVFNITVYCILFVVPVNNKIRYSNR